MGKETLPASPAEKQPETAPEATQAEGAQPDANPVESSTTDEDAKKPSLLDVVKAAVEPEEEAASSAETEEAETEQDATAEDAEPKGEADETEAERDAKLPFHEHPRWREVIAERDSLREPAQQFEKINAFMVENSLSAENVAEAFTVMADLTSKDPARLAEARKYFAANLDRLNAQLGEVLPEDLQQKVDGGYLDDEAARETARLRASEKLRTEQAETQRKAEEQRSQQDQARAAATNMANAVEAWEKGVKETDPDYSKKEPLILAQCRAIAAKEGAPKTPEEAAKLAERAYAEINGHFEALRPARRQIKAAPNGSSVVPTKEPNSLFDAVNGALAQTSA